MSETPASFLKAYFYVILRVIGYVPPGLEPAGPARVHKKLSLLNQFMCITCHHFNN